MIWSDIKIKLDKSLTVNSLREKSHLSKFYNTVVIIKTYVGATITHEESYKKVNKNMTISYKILDVY